MTIQERQLKLQNKSLFISCIVPLYNEEKSIPVFFKALVSVLGSMTNLFEIVVVDDGSKDNTYNELLKLPHEFCIKIISLSRNFGKEIALTAGLENASGEVAILMDGDFQHPMDLIHPFLEKWQEGYDMVYAVRANRKNEAKLKRCFTQLFYLLMKSMSKVDMPRNAGDFRLLDRKVIDALNSFNERSRFMKGLYAWVGFHNIAIPFEVAERTTGKSSWGFKNLAELAITGLTSFSDIPLRVWGLMGFFISAIAMIYALYFMIYTLIYGPDVPGFPSLIVAVMFLGGIQLLSIGILGEYIARIFNEVKQRPKYIISSKTGFEE